MQVSDLKDNRPLLIVGLGNTGNTYLSNRHNAGFLFVDYFIKKLQKLNKDLIYTQKKLYELVKSQEEQIFLVKPLTMMNNSGLAVKEFFKYTNLPLNSMVLVFDDLDIPLGTFKLQQGKTPKGHNGVNSITDSLNTKNFYNLRLGIENRTNKKIGGVTYVLDNFLPEELLVFEKVVKTIISQILYLNS